MARVFASGRVAVWALMAAAWACGGCAGADSRFAFGAFDVTPRFFHRASVLADGRVVVTGGLGLHVLPPTLVSLNEIAIFDPLHGGTVRRSSAVLSVPRSTHTQTTLPDGRVLITGGFVDAVGTSEGRPTASVEIFDPMTDSVAPGPPLAAPRAFHTATSLSDGRVVVAGADTWQVFTPGPDTWTSPLPLQRRRVAHAAVLMAGADGSHDRVLLVGALTSGAEAMELIDADAGVSMLTAARLDFAVDDVAAARLPDGRVLIVGGQMISGNTTDRSYLYDVAADAIQAIAPPPQRAGGIADHSLIVVGLHAFAFGGEQQLDDVDTTLDYFADFDAARGEWVAHGAMRAEHDDAPAVGLPNGSIFIIGGGSSLFGIEYPTSGTELFRPAR